MSAEYAARMEVLQRRREELTSQRQATEKRMALREATAAEFSAVALQSYKQKWKAQRSSALTAMKRNEEFVHSLHETQKQMHDNWVRLKSDQSSNNALLEQEKARYNRRIEQVYPAWQEQLQRQRVQKLRELEEKKRAVERRRYLAKKSFEKEQTLDDLIRKTRHEVEMAENLEQNELYERDLLRTQSTTQAKEVDQSIREVALEARSYLQQQAAKSLEATPELDEELAEKLSETFSPRNALRALQDANSSLTFEEYQYYEDEEKPMRQIRVEIPARMNTPTQSYASRSNQQIPAQTYFSEDDLYDEPQRNFNEMPVRINPVAAERYQVETTTGTENDYIAFKQAVKGVKPFDISPYHHPQGASRDPTSTSGVSLSTPLSHSGVKPQQINDTLGSDIVEAVSRQSRSGYERLPAVVTGTLEPILEANEQISPDKVGSRIGDSSRIRGPDINDEREHARDENSANTIVNFVSTSHPKSNSPSKKIEENRGANFPGASTVPAASLESTPNIEIRTSADSRDDIVVPQPLHGEALVQASSTNNVAEINDALLPSAGSIQPAVITRVEVLPHQTHGGVHEKSSSSQSFSHDGQQTIDDLVIDAPSRTVAHVQRSDQSDSPSSSNGPSTLNEGEPLKNKPLPTRPLGFEGDTETKSTPHPVLTPAIVDENAREREQHSRYKDKWMSESINDGDHAQDTMDATIFTMGVIASDAPKESVDERALQIEEPEVVSLYTDVLEPFSPVAAGPTAHFKLIDEDVLLTSMQSDDFELSTNDFHQNTETNPSIVSNDVADVGIAPVKPNDGPVPKATEIHSANPPGPVVDAATSQSVTEKLTPPDRVKALGALISRVEEGATEGDSLEWPSNAGSSYDSKRELLKMAVGGLKAQIAFYGSDICFELILDISRDLGPVLFPLKAFEGIMNDQKIRKLHQHNRGKELDLWKALSAHIKQLAQLNAIPSANPVELFGAAFLAHDPDNQRSQRKLREFLVMLCGGKSSSLPNRKSRASPPPSPPKQEQLASSPDSVKPYEPEGRIGTPALLQTAFLQRQSPPKPKKVFGIASSGFNDRSSASSDVLTSMGSGSMRLSQKLMRGGKMNDYSEFEEEEEVDLQNLIGTKPAFGSSAASALGRSHHAANTSASKPSAKQGVADEDDEFDADF